MRANICLPYVKIQKSVFMYFLFSVITLGNSASLGKSCSFCLPRVPFVNCRQFMYLVISLLVLRAGYGI